MDCFPDAPTTDTPPSTTTTSTSAEEPSSQKSPVQRRIESNVGITKSAEQTAMAGAYLLEEETPESAGRKGSGRRF